MISHGKITAETELNVNCISAIRKTWNDQQCIILMNINTVSAQVDLSAYEGWTLAASVSADGTPVEMDGNTLNMGAFGLAILLPQG